MASGEDNAALLDRPHARTGATMAERSPLAHLHEDQGAIGCAHDEVDFATAAPRRSIIAVQQPQALPHKVAQGRVLGRIAYVLGGRPRIRLPLWSCWKGNHVSALFTSALAASAEAAAGQHYPHGTLYMVATPIGNLADISLRALHVLGLVDAIACEDTRHTQALLRAYGIDKASSQLIALHQHNETQAAQTVIHHLREGRRVAYASDAGTPGISDPGARLVAAVQAEQLRCVPLPGPSSVTALLSVAGWVDDEPGGFVFRGFLPTKSGERDRVIQDLAAQALPVVVLEAPHRIVALAAALASLGDRPITVGRELTKQFEEIATMPASELPAWLVADANRQRGEFALVLHPRMATPDAAQDTRVLQLLLEHLPLKSAVKLAADITGAPRNTLYPLALGLKRGPDEASSEPED